MATREGESAFERLMASAVDLPEATWTGAGDLSRLSIESMVASVADVRDLASRGAVRLSGAGVSGNAADLDAVGQVATTWQRAVTAVGASLEGARAAMGRLPETVALRTRLVLNAAPAPGSIILDVAPKENPFDEVAPGGEAQLIDAPRPLADRASEELIGLLDAAATAGPELDGLAERFEELGPRVATAIKALADVLNREHFDLDATWLEPAHPTRRAALSAGSAGWLSGFVAGRALDGLETEIEGVVRTVSDIAKWSVETSEGRKYVDASSLDPETIRATHVGQSLRLLVLWKVTQKPGGSTAETYEALEVLESTE